MPSHAFFLRQLGFAIEHLPPTIPQETQEQIRAIYAELEASGEDVDQSSIEEAMIRIGKLEWPYRQAYERLVDVCCTHTQHDLLLKSLSEKTRQAFVDIGGADASVQEVVHSPLFEEVLSPEQRYEVQEAALEARLKMFDYMKGMVEQRKEEYEVLLAKAFEEQQQIDAAIARLQALVPIDEHWGPDIEAKVRQMQLGWSIAEPDVTLDQVEKELAYWQGMLTAAEAGSDEEVY